MQNVQSLDAETLKRYKRLSMHLIINKKDPLQLDEFKRSFLEQAGSDPVSVTVPQLKLIVAHIFNDDKQSYEERFVSALVGPEASRDDDKLVTFDEVQKFVDVYEASCAVMNESLADPRTYHHDPVTGH